MYQRNTRSIRSSLHYWYSSRRLYLLQLWKERSSQELGCLEPINKEQQKLEIDKFNLEKGRGNPFIGSNSNFLDASSVDTESVGVEIVDSNKNNDDTSSDS